MNNSIATPLALKIKTPPFGSMCLSPDGTLFAHSVNDPASAHFNIWDVNTGRALLRIDVPEPVGLGSFSADAKVLLTAGQAPKFPQRKGFQLWHVQTGAELPAPECDFLVVRAAFAENGMMAVCGVRMPAGVNSLSNIGELPRMEGMVQVWPSSKGGQPMALIGHQHFVGNLCFSKNCRWLATSDLRGCIRVWDLQTGSQVAQNTELKTSSAMVFVDDDQALLVMPGKTTSLWRWSSGNLIETRRVGISEVFGHSILHDHHHLAGEGAGSEICVWNARTGEPAGSVHRVNLPEKQYAFFETTAASRAPRLAISCKIENECSITFHDVRLPQVTTVPPVSLNPGEVTRIVCQDQVRSAALAPDDRACVTGSAENLQVWSLPSGQCIESAEMEDYVAVVRYSPTGDRIAAVDDKGRVRLWRTKPFAELARWDSSVGNPRLLCFSPDGTLLAIVGEPTNTEQIVLVAEAATGRQIARQQDENRTQHLDFLPTPGGWRLLRVVSVSGGCENSCLIEPLTGAGKPQVFPLDENIGGGKVMPIFSESAVMIPEKGWLLVGGSLNNCFLYDLASGKRIRETKLGNLEPKVMAASPDGSAVALAGGIRAYLTHKPHDHSIHVLDLVANRERSTFEGHSDEVTDIAMSETGEYILSCSRDYTARLWKVSA